MYNNSITKRFTISHQFKSQFYFYLQENRGEKHVSPSMYLWLHLAIFAKLIQLIRLISLKLNPCVSLRNLLGILSFTFRLICIFLLIWHHRIQVYHVCCSHLLSKYVKRHSTKKENTYKRLTNMQYPRALTQFMWDDATYPFMTFFNTPPIPRIP